MNKNKGFIGIGLILAIVLGIVVVGGGAFYLGKNNSKEEVNNLPNNPEINQNENLPVVNNQQADCNKNSPSTIKLISPNGGEVYNAGDKIIVKWESCNVDPGSIGIGLIKHDSLIPYTQQEGLNDYRGFNLGGFDPYKGTADDGIQEITLPNNSVSKLDSGKHYFISISGTGDVTNVGSGYRPGDYSDNLFTINSVPTAVSTTNWKTYINKEFGVELKYPPLATVTEKQWPSRTDLGLTYDPGYEIVISVPFITHYDAWTSKAVSLMIHKGSCNDYLPASITLEKKTINGIAYSYQDPEWTATSGMSSISKWRSYYHESPTNRCYLISEIISGLGNNERPSTYTFPSDVNKFLDSELVGLDQIVASIKIN